MRIGFKTLIFLTQSIAISLFRINKRREVSTITKKTLTPNEKKFLEDYQSKKTHCFRDILRYCELRKKLTNS